MYNITGSRKALLTISLKSKNAFDMPLYSPLLLEFAIEESMALQCRWDGELPDGRKSLRLRFAFCIPLHKALKKRYYPSFLVI